MQIFALTLLIAAGVALAGFAVGAAAGWLLWRFRKPNLARLAKENARLESKIAEARSG